MNLVILTPDKELFSGDISSIVLPGIQGSFQILKDHAPLVSALSKGTVTIQGGEGAQEFKIEKGFVEVLDNSISVLATE